MHNDKRLCAGSTGIGHHLTVLLNSCSQHLVIGMRIFRLESLRLNEEINYLQPILSRNLSRSYQDD